MVVARGGIAARDGHQMGYLLARERLASARLPPVVEYRFQATSRLPLAHPPDRGDSDTEGIADRRVAPARIELQEDMRPGQGACSGSPAMDNGLYVGAFVVGQVNHNRGGHEMLPSSVSPYHLLSHQSGLSTSS